MNRQGILTLAVAWVYACLGFAAGSLSPQDAVSVSTPPAFQDAVHSGVRHVVIVEHLDMTLTEASGLTNRLSDGMIAVRANDDGEYTHSIRGNCTGPPPERLILDPPLDTASRQCLIVVREDFLQVTESIESSPVWISSLYVLLPGVEKNNTNVMYVQGGDLYMTNMTFVGDGHGRAVQVEDYRRLYIDRAYFSQFRKDGHTVIEMPAASRATVRNATFEKSIAESSAPDFTAAGPVMGLFDSFESGGIQPAAALFLDCQFRDLVAEVPGEVAIESTRSHVFSNQEVPTIWDLELNRTLKPWPLNATADPMPSTTFAAVEANGSSFPRPSDPAFQRIVLEQAELTGLAPGAPTSAIPELDGLGTAPAPAAVVISGTEAEDPEQIPMNAPEPTAPVSNDTESDPGLAPMNSPAPSAVPNDTESINQGPSTSSADVLEPTTGEVPDAGDDVFWTKKTIVLTACIVIGGLLLLLAACTAYITFLKRSNRDAAARAKRQAAPIPTDSYTSEGWNCTSSYVSSGQQKHEGQGSHEAAVEVDLAGVISEGESEGVSAGAHRVRHTLAEIGQPPPAPPQPASHRAVRPDAGVVRSAPDKTWEEFERLAGECTTPVDRLEVALDGLCAMHALFYHRYWVLTAVDRRASGQGLVQFAVVMNTQNQVAIKFYLEKAAFEREQELYMHPDLQSTIPATMAIEDNSSGELATPYGYMFPPFIITENGQSLKEWASRNNPDFITIFQALTHVVRALERLHSCGYCHRDVNPGSILRRPNQHDWTLTDLGRTEKTGRTAPLHCSLKYSAPEVVDVLEAGDSKLVVDPATDIWAVGVIAFELLTGEVALPLAGLGPAEAEQVALDAIAGRTPLPWEGSQSELWLPKLGGLRRTVTQCLERTPSQRPSAQALLQSWEHQLDSMHSQRTITRRTDTITHLS